MKKKNGETGEACAEIVLEDEGAEQIKAALAPNGDLLRRLKAEGFCRSCEYLRGRMYVENSLKSAEVKEVNP